MCMYVCDAMTNSYVENVSNGILEVGFDTSGGMAR